MPQRFTVAGSPNTCWVRWCLLATCVLPLGAFLPACGSRESTANESSSVIAELTSPGSTERGSVPIPPSYEATPISGSTAVEADSFMVTSAIYAAVVGADVRLRAGSLTLSLVGPDGVEALQLRLQAPADTTSQVSIPDPLPGWWYWRVEPSKADGDFLPRNSLSGMTQGYGTPPPSAPSQVDTT